MYALKDIYVAGLPQLLEGGQNQRLRDVLTAYLICKELYWELSKTPFFLIFPALNDARGISFIIDSLQIELRVLESHPNYRNVINDPVLFSRSFL